MSHVLRTLLLLASFSHTFERTPVLFLKPRRNDLISLREIPAISLCLSARGGTGLWEENEELEREEGTMPEERQQARREARKEVRREEKRKIEEKMSKLSEEHLLNFTCLRDEVQREVEVEPRPEVQIEGDFQPFLDTLNANRTWDEEGEGTSSPTSEIPISSDDLMIPIAHPIESESDWDSAAFDRELPEEIETVVDGLQTVKLENNKDFVTLSSSLDACKKIAGQHLPSAGKHGYVFVRNISHSVTDQDLEQNFAAFGGYVSSKVVKDFAMDPRIARIRDVCRLSASVFNHTCTPQLNRAAMEKTVEKLKEKEGLAKKPYIKSEDLEDTFLDALLEPEGKKSQAEWMEEHGITSGQPAADNLKFNFTGFVGESRLPYALVEFCSSDLAKFAVGQQEHMEVGGRNVSLALAWDEDKLILNSLEKITTRIKAIDFLHQLLPFHMLDGDDSATALLYLCRKKPDAELNVGEPFYSNIARICREGPDPPRMLHPMYQPYNKKLCMQHEIVSTLLLRALELAPMMSTDSISTVLYIISQMHVLKVNLPAGIDFRTVLLPLEGNQEELLFSTAPETYGWPGIAFNVWHKLQRMRKGAGLEMMLMKKQRHIDKYKLTWRGEKLGASFTGHLEPKNVRRRRDSITANPYVPGRLFEGHDLVQVGYTGRSKRGLALSRWLGYDADQLRCSEETLVRIANKTDAEIRRKERVNWLRAIKQEFGLQNNSEAMEYVKELDLKMWSELVYDGEEENRCALDNLWFTDYNPEMVPGGPDPEETFGKWKPNFDITGGISDPITGRFPMERRGGSEGSGQGAE
eukprot:767256-Hanusia_phi.AAC.1